MFEFQIGGSFKDTKVLTDWNHTKQQSLVPLDTGYHVQNALPKDQSLHWNIVDDSFQRTLLSIIGFTLIGGEWENKLLS